MRDVEDHEEVEYDVVAEGVGDDPDDPIIQTLARRFATVAEADAFAARVDDALAGRMDGDDLRAFLHDALPARATLAGGGARRVGVRTFKAIRSRGPGLREVLPTSVAWMSLRNLDARCPWTNTQPTREMAEHALGPHEGVLVPLFAGLPPSPGYLEGLIRMRAVIAAALPEGEGRRDAVLAACDAEVAAAEATSPAWGMSLPEVVMRDDGEGAGRALRHATAGLAVWPAPSADRDVDVGDGDRGRASELLEAMREFASKVGPILDRVG